MKVQRLIKKYKKLEGVWDAEGAEIARRIFLQDLEQLDEPKPVVVPQFVADWYEENKDDFEYNVWDWISSKDEPEKIQSEFAFWVNDVENNPIQTLVNMHQFGYEVEEEKRYTVKVKGVCGNHETLNCEKHLNEWLFSSSEENRTYKTKFTRKELEDANFGWVFDCEGVEVEEVE